MANLSVSYCGVTYKNPVIMASSGPSWNGNGMRLAAEAGAGGVVPKTIGPKDDWSCHPRNGRHWIHYVGKQPVGQFNLELFTTKTRDEWTMHELAEAKKGGAVMHISLLAMPDPADTAALVEEIQATGLADLFELNVSCPLPASTVGLHIGKSADLTYRQIEAAAKAAKIPLTVKMTPNVPSMVEIAQAAKEAGASGLTISNGVRAFAGVDIETGLPYQRACAGFTGPAIKPIVMRHVCEVARNVDLPIAAVGGVQSYKDIIEYIMLGATVVELATSVMWNGYPFITKLIRDLDTWMDEKGYSSFDDIRGIALPHITTIEELAKEPPLFAEIDSEKCISCGKCSRVCFYGAVRKKDGQKPSIDREACDGCGACSLWCTEGAITLR